MCIKFICTDHEHEFNLTMPLEQQVVGAKEILVSYDPVDPKIDSFFDQIERICDTGIACTSDIKFKSNNYLNGLKLERKIENIKRKLDINEVIRGLSKFHKDTDDRLNEISNMCLEKINEQ